MFFFWKKKVPSPWNERHSHGETREERDQRKRGEMKRKEVGSDRDGTRSERWRRVNVWMLGVEFFLLVRFLVGDGGLFRLL